MKQRRTNLTYVTRFCLTAFLFISFASMSSAQDWQNRKFALNFRAPMLSWISASSNYQSSAGVNLGYSIGTSMDFAINNNVYLSGGLQFTGNNGGTVRYSIGGNLWPRARLSNQMWNTGDKPLPDGVELNYKINMIEVPFSLKLYTNYNGNNRFFFELPMISLGVIIKSRGEITAPNINATDELITAETRSMMINLGAGAGLVHDVGFAELYIGLYYQYGVTNLSRNNGRIAIGEPGNYTLIDDQTKLTMQSLGLKMGIMF